MANEGKILVVDDELFSREYFQKILKKIDCQVISVSTGLEGLEMFKNESFDLLILDIRLPDENGIDVLKKWMFHI